ncbi:hypothetical protein LK07_10005 [Streptomyces pluripotens]|uniref:Lipoprotein n=1 Tax=Streptomyces pluripotens TaxID=1355015 RepID=A0A221NWZ0_9ACTN|nr:hypothetical protein [Streptomyces pluripotens]ARP70066.1 hypothetical protein LK06_008895 [Streptomyces pluripotens]ASN24326.1 hypothetical protein LK07_10005 [Streptomyces pluripotens]
MRIPARARLVTPAVVVSLLGLMVVSCGSGSGSGSGAKPRPSVSRAVAERGYEAAYDAGWRVGRRLFESGGKGAAVRETVWGGCVRRSLTARPQNVVERDRGAWVLGCTQAMGTGTDRQPPVRPVTRRESAPDLLARFQTWAVGNGRKQPARHAGQAVLVHLGDRDYDVELTTSYTDKSAKADVQRLADAFATWWDGDDGDDSTAWNLILLARDGRRLTTRDL